MGQWLCSLSFILPIGWGQACLVSHRTSVSVAWQIPHSRTYFTTKRNISPSPHWKRSTMVASKWINAPDFCAISLLLCQLMPNTKWGTLFIKHSTIFFFGWSRLSTCVSVMLIWRAAEALGPGQFSLSVFSPNKRRTVLGSVAPVAKKMIICQVCGQVLRLV